MGFLWQRSIMIAIPHYRVRCLRHSFGSALRHGTADCSVSTTQAACRIEAGAKAMAQAPNTDNDCDSDHNRSFAIGIPLAELLSAVRSIFGRRMCP